MRDEYEPMILVNPRELREAIDAHVDACFEDRNFEELSDDEFLSILLIASQNTTVD